MNESFDFNKVRDNKPSIAGVIKNSAISLIEENVLPLFNNLRPDYKERYRFIPEHRFIGNKCELLYQNKVIIDFTFGYDYIEEMNVYDTTRLTVVGYNGYILDVSVIFYVVRQIPIPINTLNFCYDSSKYPAYKFEGDIAHDEMRDLTRIMEDYTDSLPEHITFNSKYIDLYNLRFENENAIKKFLYKIRKDNGEQKYEIKQCIFITETPPEFRGLPGASRSKGTTSKLIRKYIKAPVNTLLESFNFDTVNKEKPKLNIFSKIRKIIETPYDNLSEDDKIFIKSMKDNMPPFKVNTKDKLESIISQATKLFGNKCDLNWIDVSSINDMSNLFAGSSFDKEYNIFNGDISLWDVSNVTDMSGMFRASMFNSDISQWDVSNVTDMDGMFYDSNFNGDISQWDVSNVTNMEGMFEYSKFNGDISNWDVSSVTNMYCMFSDSTFNGNISKWNVSNVKDMSFMFKNTGFNHDISNWNINNVTDKYEMFNNCKIRNIYKPKKKKKLKEGFDFDTVNKEKPKLNIFSKIWKIIETPINKLSTDDKIFIKSMKDNMPIYKVNSKKDLKIIISHARKLFGNKCDLNWIDVSSITDMSSLFAGNMIDNIFNGDISQWDVSNVTNMSYMFALSKFNGDISLWDVSNVTNMYSMFMNSKFNGDISLWDVSNATNMNAMFLNSKFNGDISQWNVSNVTDMGDMFDDSVFNRDISLWDVSNVTNMYGMFSFSEFNGDISQWDVSNVITMREMFALSKFNGDISLWDVSNVTNMNSMFYNSEFNGDISLWDVSNVTKKSYIFSGCPIKKEYKPKFK